jgi:hypothetical protein
MQDYTKTPREDWVRKWQGMCTLCVSMMFWTSMAEDAMKKAGISGLNMFYDKLLK